MKTTVKRVLWQRTLDVTVLRRPLPVATAPASPGITERLTVDVRVDTSALEAWLAQWQHALEQVDARDGCSSMGWHDPTELRRQEDGSMKQFRPHRAKRAMLFGMDFAQGGVRDQTLRLVGEVGPELRLTIPAGALKVGAPLSFSQYVNQFLASMQQMAGEVNEASGERDADDQGGRTGGR